MDYKKLYGLVETPVDIVERMLNLLEEDIFKDESKRWLDTGAGSGVFSKQILCRIPKVSQIDLVEINEYFEENLKSNFDNVFMEDFLNFDRSKYDVIVGNPPYNRNGSKKVPTNNKQNKKDDGQTLWINFLYKSLELLNPNGTLCYIIPSIWMKNNHIVYKTLIKYQLKYIVPFTNTESNKIFSGNCQTPTCILVLKKETGNGIVNIYDKVIKNFVSYDTKFNRHMPLLGVNLVSEMYDLSDKYGALSKYVNKTNVISGKIKTSKEKTTTHRFKNVETCLLNKKEPYLKIGYSNNACPYYGEKKIILAHKMYGFPYMDNTGVFGISKRDNYVITGLCESDFEKVFNLLTSNLVFFIMETTRYRMKYLEKYVFDFIPDILNMEKHKQIITFDKDYTISSIISGNRLQLEYDINSIYEKYFEHKYIHFRFDFEYLCENNEEDKNENKIET